MATNARAHWSTDSLSVARSSVADVTAGDKAYFAGGRNGSGYSDVVDIYDDASGTWSTATLSLERASIAATAVGDYVLFAGGTTSNTTSSAVVDVLNTQAMVWSTTTLSQARYTSATTVGAKAIFAGGYGGGPLSPFSSDVVDIYDATLGAPGEPAAWSTATLSLARGHLAAATAGDCALFAGGRDDTLMAGLHEYDTVDIYNNTTGVWSTASLTEARAKCGAATDGTRAYFAGGAYANIVSDVVDIYDSATATWTSETLSFPRVAPSATALGDAILFAGGFTNTGTSSDIVDILDAGTGVWRAPTHLSLGRGDMGHTTVGRKALFAGGYGGGVSDLIDIYRDTWFDLGLGLAGDGDVTPQLAGNGNLVAGTPAVLTLSDALPGSQAWLFLGLSQIDVPFRGGTLVPSTDFLFPALPINGSGELVIGANWPPLPSGTAVYFQYWVVDPAGPFGASASNGLVATTP